MRPSFFSRRLVPAASALAFVSATGCDAQPTYPESRTGTFTSDFASLAYTMDMPSGRGPFPVVVLVHGSGRTTRDEMLDIVPRFLSRGIAILRYDKRGVGASEGVYSGVGPINSTTMIPQLARDAAAAFATACNAPGIEQSRCGFFGASQAGWVIAEALPSLPRAAFAILFSGPTVSVGRENAYSRIAETGAGTLDSAYAAVDRFTGVEGYDPAFALSQIQTPMLWLLGADDNSIPSRTVAAQLAVASANSRPFVFRLFEGYGHSLGPLVWPEIDNFLSQTRVSCRAANQLASIFPIVRHC